MRDGQSSSQNYKKLGGLTHNIMVVREPAFSDGGWRRLYRQRKVSIDGGNCSEKTERGTKYLVLLRELAFCELAGLLTLLELRWSVP